jgi:hypothetical protein
VKFATGLRRLQADNVQFIPNRSTLSLSERKLSPAGGQLVEIRVSDHGTGLTGDKLEKIFQPFYTSKQTVWCGALHQPLHHRGAWRASLGGEQPE